MVNARYLISTKWMVDAEEFTYQNRNKPNPKNPPIIIADSCSTKICNEVVTSKKFEVKLLRIGIRVNMTEKSAFDALYHTAKCQHAASQNSVIGTSKYEH